MSMTLGSVGGLPVYLFGCIASVGIVLGLLITRWTTWLYDEPFPFAVDAAVLGIPLGLIFGRIGHVARFWEFFGDDPMKILYFWEGGFSPYGAGLGFLLALYICASKDDVSFWHWLDILAPAFSVMIVLYAFSGFFLQQTVGMPLPLDIPNDSALAEYVEYSYRPSGFEGYEYFRPVALYQTGLMSIVFLITIILTVLQAKRQIMQTGKVALVSFFLTAVVRFGCGFFYLSTRSGLHMGQIAALGVMAVCLILLLVRRRKKIWSVYH